MITPSKDFSNTSSQKPPYFVQKTDANSSLREIVSVDRSVVNATNFEFASRFAPNKFFLGTSPYSIGYHIAKGESQTLGTTTKFNSVFLESHKSYKKTASLENYPIKDRQFARVSNFKLLASAKKLLANTAQNRVCVCFAHRQDKDKNIFIAHNMKVGNSAYAYYRNIVQCSDVHTCIICNNRIMSKRGEKAAEAYNVWVHDRNNFVPMLTLTIPHYLNGVLKVQLRLIKKAFKRLMNDRVMRGFWSDMGRVGIVDVHEYTYGKHGHHNHIHALPYLTKDIRKTKIATTVWATPKRMGQVRYLNDAQAQKLVSKGLQGTITYQDAEDFISDYWKKVCVEVGLSAPSRAHGAKFTYGEKVKRYLAKSKSAQEITNSRAKKAKGDNRNQWELLLDYADGDCDAGDIFREYAAAFKATQLLQFSKGLLHELGLKTEQDEKDELKQAVADGELDETANDLKEISPAVWKLIKIYHKQADVLSAVENDYLHDTNEYYELIADLICKYDERQRKREYAEAAMRGMRMRDMRPPAYFADIPLPVCS